MNYFVGPQKAMALFGFPIKLVSLTITRSSLWETDKWKNIDSSRNPARAI